MVLSNRVRACRRVVCRSVWVRCFRLGIGSYRFRLAASCHGRHRAVPGSQRLFFVTCGWSGLSTGFAFYLLIEVVGFDCPRGRLLLRPSPNSRAFLTNFYGRSFFQRISLMEVIVDPRKQPANQQRGTNHRTNTATYERTYR